MLGLPEWAIGVAAALILITGLQIIYVRLMPPESRRRGLKGEPLQLPEDVQARLAELDEMKHRLAELEERADFTERLLAQQREPERLRRPE